MFQAQLLNGATNGAVYSPWFERQGDYLRATVEVVAMAGSTGVTVTVLTKNKEDTGDGTAVSGSIAQSSAGRGTTEFTTLKELVRFKFDPGTTSTSWVLFRMLPAVWFDAVKV